MRAQERDITTIWLPQTLAKEAGALAEKEGRTKSELIREALRQYIWITKWSRLRQYGGTKSVELRLQPEKINSIVHAYRSKAKRAKGSR